LKKMGNLHANGALKSEFEHAKTKISVICMISMI